MTEPGRKDPLQFRGWEPLPVGVRLLRATGEHADVPLYQGVSYCDAVGRAGRGESLRVLPGSIEVCRWAPVVLGLKQPEGRFERGLAPRLAFPVAGVLLAPLDRFPGEPQVVILHGEPARLKPLIQAAEAGGQSLLWDGHHNQLARSALPALVNGRPGLRARLIDPVNRVLAAMAGWGRWQAFTRRLFRSRATTAAFDALISHTLADMSVCRNSTVVPLLTGRANISFFCTGGITWGGNRADHVTSGWPWPMRIALPPAGIG